MGERGFVPCVKSHCRAWNRTRCRGLTGLLIPGVDAVLLDGAYLTPQHRLRLSLEFASLGGRRRVRLYCFRLLGVPFRDRKHPMPRLRLRALDRLRTSREDDLVVCALRDSVHHAGSGPEVYVIPRHRL